MVVIVDRDEDRLGMKEFEMVALSGYPGHRLYASRWSEDLLLSSIIPLLEISTQAWVLVAEMFRVRCRIKIDLNLEM